MERNPGETTLEITGGYTDWTMYEGRIPLNENDHLYLEISMLPGDRMGEGSYRLAEFLEKENTYTPVSKFDGKYSTLYGDSPEERIIQFINSAQPEGVIRTYHTRASSGSITQSPLKMIREESFRNTDLAVKIERKNALIVLDQNLKALSPDPAHHLTKRTSKLFTVEGYFRHNGDTADFFEMNTREQWAVSKLGNYHQATRQYHKLARKKFEVTYIKATGYSVRHVTRDGKEIDALVFKRVLQMTSSPTITDEYNLLTR
jgi:hypothetical protein